MNNYSNRNIDSTADIKHAAKKTLEGHWTDAVLTALIPTVFSFLFYNGASDADGGSIVFDIIESFLLTGMTFGFMNLARNRQYILRPFQEIASPFRSTYLKNLFFLKLWKYLYIFLWTLLFIIPGIVKSYSYSQAELIYKDYVDHTGEQPDARTVLRESSRMMEGYKGALFLLDFSFIGWHILNGITFGILGLWLTPYTSMSKVVFYEILTAGQYGNRSEPSERTTARNQTEEVGKDPDDFRDFEDF